jgi:hypothetical protein
MASPLHVTRRRAIAYRLLVNNLTERLPAGAHARAARYALQDSYPRSALLSLYARLESCAPNAWAHDSLVQT